MYFGPYKWLTFDRCTISTVTFSFMTLEGLNTRIIDSIINTTNTIQISTFQSLIKCEYFLPKYTGIANNFIGNNNTFIGLSTMAWDQTMHFQNHMNVTFTNNFFDDMSWRDDLSFLVEHFSVHCPFELYSKIVISNNTILNPTVKRISNIYFTLALNTDGINDVIIQNNYYSGVLYSKPGFFKITKPLLKKLNLVFENFTVENSVNINSPQPCITIEAEKVRFRNVKIANSNITRFLKMQAMEADI